GFRGLALQRPAIGGRQSGAWIVSSHATASSRMTLRRGRVSPPGSRLAPFRWALPRGLTVAKHLPILSSIPYLPGGPRRGTRDGARLSTPRRHRDACSRLVGAGFRAIPRPTVPLL